MKKIKVLSLFLVIVLILAMFAGCGKKDDSSANSSSSDSSQSISQDVDDSSNTNNVTEDVAQETLESYMNSNPTVMEQAKSSVDENMTVSVSGNTLTYVYDFSKMEGIDKDTALSNTMKDSLDSTLDSYSSTFSSLCSTLESATKIKGIKILVKYTYGDDVISQKEFEAK